MRYIVGRVNRKDAMMDSIISELNHFEENQLSIGNTYGAEVLCRARVRIQELLELNRKYRNYLTHRPGCEIWSNEGHGCDCGLWELLNVG